MKTYLSLYCLFISITIQAQPNIEFFGFEEYGYTLTVNIIGSDFVETELSGKCKIINNTEDTIISRIKAVTPKTVVGINGKIEQLLPHDTTVFYFAIYYPFEKTRPMPIIENVLDAKTYDIWDKNSLFDYFKKSDMYYRVGLKIYSDIDIGGENMIHFL